MGEVNLSDALADIHSDTRKKRTDGLADLKHILSQNRRGPKIEVLGDKAYHQILEALFRVVKIECSTYAKSSKSTKTAAKTRLSLCAEIVRTAVETGVKKIRAKTVRAVVGHITQTLPGSDEGYCEPLVKDYFKTLGVVLGYPPHAEHFSKGEWCDLVDFCNETLHDLNSITSEKSSSFPDGNSTRDSWRSGPSRSATPGVDIDQRHRASHVSSQENGLLQLRNCAEELVLCLYHLTSVPHAAILDKAPVTLANLLELLESSSSAGNAQQAAFECINSIMARIMTDDVSLALQTLRNLLPTIRRLWDAKTSALKDHMMKLMLYGEVCFPRLISSDEADDCKSNIKGLLEALQQDYCKRPEREQLQLEDLLFSNNGSVGKRPSSTKVFELRSGAAKAEKSWFLLSIYASLVIGLDSDLRIREKIAQADDFENPPKRRKVTRNLDDIFQATRTTETAQKLFALQVLTFVFGKLPVDGDGLDWNLEALLPCLSDDNGSVASWAMLVLASAADRLVTRPSRLQGFWLQACQLAARYVTSSTTCRAACQLMTVLLTKEHVQYKDIVSIVDPMIASVDLNGPVDCVDSACTLWTVLMLLRGRENLGLVFETSEHVLRWLFRRWRPTKFFDRKYAIQSSHYYVTPNVFLLISKCLGFQSEPTCLQPFLGLGPLSQASFKCLEDGNQIKYLLLVDESPITPSVESQVIGVLHSSAINLSRLQFQALSEIALDFLLVESELLLQSIDGDNPGVISTVNSAYIFATSSLSIIGYILLSHEGIGQTLKARDLLGVLGKVQKGIIRCITHQEKSLNLIDGLYEAIGPFIESLTNITSDRDLVSNGLVSMAGWFGPEFWTSLHASENQDGLAEAEDMNLDDEFVSQGSRRRTEPLVAEISHNEVTAFTDGMAFRNSLATKICLLSGMKINSDGNAAENFVDTRAFMNYLTSLRPNEFLACRPFLHELFLSNITINTEDAVLLLAYLGQKIIKPYEFERCEVSMVACLEIMTSLAHMWTSSGNGEIFDVGGTLYEWFINVALNHGFSSPKVYCSISNMLQRVIKIQPEYARSRNDTLPSARTSLFRVLQDGDIKVKFHVGQNISEIFGLFVLVEHDNILGDIIDNLPSAIDWQEGIALRLFVLARLAGSWPTLLRRCVYAIFETAGHAPDSCGHAKYCLTLISESLGLRSLHRLFKLFVAQIIYTWLETQPLRSMPYMIFGYGSLSELLEDVQDEVLGQIVMRGKDEEAAQLAQDLGKPYEQLLELSFSKAAAYSIARDVAVPPSSNSQAPGAEMRLRKTLGKEKHTLLIHSCLPQIISFFFKTLDELEDIGRGFQKHPAYAGVYNSYQSVISISSSETILPVNQQPSFKARYLIDEIEHLCRRTSYDAESIWSPELYVYVFRELLNTIHPALGSLHACSVLRRIRILICMAGPTALEFYPIEMALHSLRPYITNTYCAQDAIGMAQYLMQHGVPYLKEVPSFVAGMAISTLTSMKGFLGSTQESTTQESQFRATMLKASTFHGWLASFLDHYISPYISDESEQSFKALVRSAKHLHNNGNAKKGTYESDLLLEIFEDQRSGRCILNQPSQDLILNLLCTTFEVPATFRDDILGSDKQAALYAPTIWRTCKRNHYGREYLLWVGRVLGRAYLATGLIDRDMTVETCIDFDQGMAFRHNAEIPQSSRSSILKLLCDVLSFDDPSEIGLAETTLRSIITRVNGTEYASECERTLPNALIKGMLWRQYNCPSGPPDATIYRTVQECTIFESGKSVSLWVQDLCVALARVAVDDPTLQELAPILGGVENLAEKSFPYVLHLVLLKEIGGHQATRRTVSAACLQWFRNCNEWTIPHVKILLKAILYLREQPLPHETAKADRSGWLELDYKLAAEAASKCSMFKTALLFLEVNYSEASKASRRSSGIKVEDPTDLLIDIYESIDEQDAFYGVQQPSSLASMMARLEYENAGFKSLSFRGAHYDSRIRHLKGPYPEDEGSIVKILDTLDLNGLAQSFLTKTTTSESESIDSFLRTARKLEQWDISAPISHISTTSIIFRAFQSFNSSADLISLRSALDMGIQEALKILMGGNHTIPLLQTALSTLSILTEADEVFSSTGTKDLQETWSRFMSRNSWMDSASFQHISSITSCRETLLSSLSKNKNLQEVLKTSQRDSRALEITSLLASTKMSRHHGALQNSLATATYLNRLIEPCKEVGVNITAAVQFESASVLWDQGELTASIKILQDLQNRSGAESQLIHVGKPELLAKLGHQISEARLEKPDEIINQYLVPAIKELHGISQGDEAGQVFHEFASFCDQQLQNVDGLEDFERIKKLRERKETEVRDLERMIKSSGSQTKEKDNLKSHRAKAKQWFDLDDREYQRLLDSRHAFLRQSLENYLLSLKACEKYDNDALRFSALWLENWESEIANSAVSKHVAQVGSRKFAPLMNQWSSRLLDTSCSFQKLLSSLVLRICIDHPYHGMYQIFAGSKTKGGKDETALARHAAANYIVNHLKATKKAASTWLAIHNTNISFVRFAADKMEDLKIKPGAKVALRKSATGQRLEQDLHSQKIPPPTMKIPLRADCDYRDVPTIAKFQPEFAVASGISMPKVVTAIGTDGLKYKQLFKGGNDDLRQDAIMEQVFEQVSNLLQAQQATRQRNLGIRTYKVLPLTATSGIIEFVPNTIPLHDYLMPAHQRHFPKDLKPTICRKHIADAQSKSVDQRIKTFRQVTDHFHPVLRYFFMERFENPDDWFDRRLAYTRSTAAISILGHVLGLGDRHGHNILLDEKTGEVIHIDLGIAFEQGRVLPVPEVVPFRLTRDLVDGMGITRTEGVFRRCCEFTLDALRKESYSIMTILDVLRYDPLYSWSLSPLRLKKLQDGQNETSAPAVGDGDELGKKADEPGEADRALTVVAKKLSKSLSVTATVNELIQNATDERNLAVLFAGWAAYA